MSKPYRFLAVAALAAGLYGAASARPHVPAVVQFVYTSDAHYGLTRASFHGVPNVDAHSVNADLVSKINSLPTATGGIDFLVETGDVANRSEVIDGTSIQSAAASWKQFDEDYLRGLTLRTPGGAPTPVFLVPGNHDASNAVGFYRSMVPATDPTSIVKMYNLMMKPAVPKTAQSFEYDRDRVLYSRDVGGVHFVFVQVWPDSLARTWMENDLSRVDDATPIVLFTHDQPDAEAKHFRNPNGSHGLSAVDRFENLLSDTFQDGASIEDASILEQRALETFLRRHPNVVAYFHGNSNWNEFYDWKGPDHTIALHTFRVDSPMKGRYSSADERRLSFQVARIDMASLTMTVRECLWDTDPQHPSTPVRWGASTTVSLSHSHPSS